MTYLILKLEGREICRTLIQKESIVGSCSTENAKASDNGGEPGDCSFSRTSNGKSPETIVQEKKSWLNYELMGREFSNPKHKKSSVQKRRSNNAKITLDKQKVEWLKASRDYSFLSSDDIDNMVNPNPWTVKNVSKSCASMAKKKLEEARKPKTTLKPQSLSSKPWSKESGLKNSCRSNLKGHVRKRKQVIYDDDDDDDVDGINVESTCSGIREEETRSSKIGRKEEVVKKHNR